MRTPAATAKEIERSVATDHHAVDASHDAIHQAPQVADPRRPAPAAPLPVSAGTLAPVLGHAAGGGRGNGPVRQAALLQLQRTHGNRSARRMIQRSAPGGAASAPPGLTTATPALDSAAPVPVSAEAPGSVALPPVAGPPPAPGEHPGAALPAPAGETGIPVAVQAKMERAFDADFSDVRIHANSQQAVDLGALAFAQGTEIHFAPGQYQPESHAGQEVLGHELAHVVQQRQGRVGVTRQAKGLPLNDDHGLESEADTLGRQAAAAPAAPPVQRTRGSQPTGATPGRAPIQRLTTATPVWAPVDASGEGTEVTIHPLGAVPPPGGSDAGQSNTVLSRRRMNLFTAASESEQYVQGHLLNEQMGGPGDEPKNLTAFPKFITNADHKNLAETVINKGRKAGGWYKYHVKVTYSTDSLPRLLKRLGYDPESPTDQATFNTHPTYGNVNIDATKDTTFRYASHLALDWDELDPLSPQPGTSTKAHTASLNIPSPLSYVGGGTRRSDSEKATKRDQAYPGKPLSHAMTTHATKFKESQTWTRNPPHKTKGAGGRPYEEPVAWKAVSDIQGGTVDAARKTAGTVKDNDYKRATTHYDEGVKAAQDKLPAKRYGLAFTTGKTDYDAGVADAKSGKAAHATNPGQQAGHKDYVDGQAHARASLANLLGADPAESGKKTGFDEYKAGVEAYTQNEADDAKRPAYSQGWKDCEAGRKDASAQLAGGTLPAALVPAKAESGYLWGFYYEAGVAVARADLASPAPSGTVPAGIAGVGHGAYLTGYKAARKDPKSAAPAERGGATGHADYLAGATAAETNLSGPVPAESAAQAGFTDYKDGVTLAETTRPGGTPPATPAGLVGFTHFWEGVTHAQASLDNLVGATPAESGRKAGFEAYRAGVQAHKAGTANDPKKLAFAQGWLDCEAGRKELRQQLTAGTPLKDVKPTKTEGGYAWGFYYEAGVAVARADLGSGAPSGSTPDTVAAVGHAAYLAGYQAARGDLKAAAPTEQGQATGHADYLAGVTAARADLSAAPPTESAARAAFAEYQEGVKLARTTGPGATVGNAAGQAGFDDFWAGAAHAQASLDSLAGAPPAESGKKEGFAEYKAGVTAHQAGSANDGKRVAYSAGWQECEAGRTELRRQVAASTPLDAVKPGKTESGYLWGFYYEVGVAMARADLSSKVEGTTTAHTVAAAGHAAYLAGYNAARSDSKSTAPAEQGGATGHADYQAGVAAARANLDGTAPTESGVAAGFAEYKAGVTLARTTAPTGTPPATVGGKAGFEEFWAGAAHAQANLDNLAGAAPDGSGRQAGFAEYKAGVDAHQAGRANDGTRPAYATAWADCADGRADLRLQVASSVAIKDAKPAKSTGGYAWGFYYEAGVAVARADLGSTVSRTDTASTVAAAGHAAYVAGYNAARSDSASTTPTEQGGAAGHTEYLAGLAAARTDLDGAPPAGSAAQTGFAEYKDGVTQARTALPTATPPATVGGKAGFDDFWAGVTHAQTSLDNLEGAAPAGSGNQAGFALYRTGVTAHKTGGGPDGTHPAANRGWRDCADGRAELRRQVDAGTALNAVAAPSTNGGYLSGFYYEMGVATARGGSPAPGGSTAANIAAAGHAAYIAGYNAARANLGGVAPTAPGGAAGHAEYRAGVDHARAAVVNLHGAVPTDSSAKAQGFQDYRAGVVARGQPVPAADDPTRPAYSLGWNDYNDGVQAAMARTINMHRRESGYTQGFTDAMSALHAASVGGDDESPTKKHRDH